ncbi:hypothetical protein GGQ68_001883 [Sagittula marina]|uniref:DUF7742 domain-containing protein n=1 Tax=Sagittula marina TaxID=943940 RepID=A0A7W6GS40_9RHOB|nr:hypothetical protein [Sagittula marina]MBB3985550.1 hypothetical protein [Sagittula marina]
MRPVLAGDVTAVARALLRVPQSVRPGLAHDIIAQAHAADRHRRRLGKCHAHWGDGTLMAAALAHPIAKEPNFGDPDYLHCHATIIDALRRHFAPSKERI